MRKLEALAQAPALQALPGDEQQENIADVMLHAAILQCWYGG
jgi:hypothetical protein